MPDEVIVVFDSNVLIPAIIPASLSARLFTRLEAAGWIVAASPQLLAEVRDKLVTKPSLRQWLGLSDEAIDEFVDTTLPGKTRWIAGTYTAPRAVPADPKDDMVIAAAVEAGASYLISERLERHPGETAPIAQLIEPTDRRNQCIYARNRKILQPKFHERASRVSTCRHRNSNGLGNRHAGRTSICPRCYARR